MNETEFETIKEFYSLLENGIENLPSQQREMLYKKCAIDCVKKTAYPELKRQFEECNKNLDEQYEKYGRTPYFFADIIEKGHIYEMGYPSCYCPMVTNSLATSAVHCECSKQSILFVLNSLVPDKKITIETIHTILSGADECRFRVTVE